MEAEHPQSERVQPRYELGAVAAARDRLSKDALLAKLAIVAGAGELTPALRLLTRYIGASHFLLGRFDLISGNGLDFVVSSNWPFDLVRMIESEVIERQSRSTEIEKCLSVLSAHFAALPEVAEVQEGISRQYCTMPFSVGRSRYSLLFLFHEDMILSQERLREIGLLAGYCISLSVRKSLRNDRDCELTEREVECLFWIAEGKTSDEIATILGISRNTINNYITSVMRKTATKTRSEAIAYAVRNNLV